VEARLPTHLEVAALIRRTESQGGFATVLQRGERESGTIMLVLCARGTENRSYERMPQLDGIRQWHCSRRELENNREDFDLYIKRRGEQDPDLWILELDIADGERLIGLTTPVG
jgi:hypothetical protein